VFQRCENAGQGDGFGDVEKPKLQAQISPISITIRLSFMNDSRRYFIIRNAVNANEEVGDVNGENSPNDHRPKIGKPVGNTL